MKGSTGPWSSSATHSHSHNPSSILGAESALCLLHAHTVSHHSRSTPHPPSNSQLTGHQGTASSSVFRDSWATFALWGSFPAWAHPLILMEYMLCTSRGNKNTNQQRERCFISSCFPLEMAQAFFVVQSESNLSLNANTQPFFPSTIPSVLRSMCFRSLWAAVRYHHY